MEIGDVVVAHTDGITESENKDGYVKLIARPRA
jgi:serine phosphatase RsbU (regulator of sigma subunit)